MHIQIFPDFPELLARRFHYLEKKREEKKKMSLLYCKAGCGSVIITSQETSDDYCLCFLLPLSYANRHTKHLHEYYTTSVCFHNFLSFSFTLFCSLPRIFGHSTGYYFSTTPFFFACSFYFFFLCFFSAQTKKLWTLSSVTKNVPDAKCAQQYLFDILLWNWRAKKGVFIYFSF